MTVRLSAQYQL